MAQLKRYNGTSWETVGGSIAPKNTHTSSTTDTYSCDYVNDALSGDLVVDSIRTKNIFNGMMERGSFVPATGALGPATNRIRSAFYTNVESGTYTISVANANKYVVVYVYNTDGTYIESESNTSWQPLPFTKTFSENRKIKIGIKNSDDSTIVISDIQDIMIEKNESKTTYIPHQNLNGSIVESGSNSNGNWIKYSDGSMICYNKISLTLNVASSYENVYYANSGDITFPQEFASQPVVNITLRNLAACFTFYNIYTSYFNGYMWKVQSKSNVPLDINYIAIGKWK